MLVLSRANSRFGRSGISKRLASPTATGSLTTRGVEWIYLLVLFLLAGGVINAIGNAGQIGIGSAPIVPSPNAQNVTETFIMLFIYIIGALGAYAIYLSARQTIRARSSEMFFFGGIVFMLLAISIGYFILSIK